MNVEQMSARLEALFNVTGYNSFAESRRLILALEDQALQDAGLLPRVVATPCTYCENEARMEVRPLVNPSGMPGLPICFEPDCEKKASWILVEVTGAASGGDEENFNPAALAWIKQYEASVLPPEERAKYEFKCQLAQAFKDHALQNGYGPGALSNGYDTDEGDHYVTMLDGFFDAVKLTEWEAQMLWYTGGSHIVAQRDVTPNDHPDKFEQLETFDVVHVLGGQAEYDELVKQFIDDLFVLAERVGATLELPSH